MQLTDEERSSRKSVYTSFPGDRMRPYLTSCNHNPFVALKLYEWNSQASAALYETLGHFEILYRNRIDEALASRHVFKGRAGDWLDNGFGEFSSRAGDAINEAEDRARGVHNNSGSTRGLIIAELNLGFWRRLLDERYDNVHGSAVMRMFPKHKRANNNDMSNLRALIEPLYSLRNRIAHHEPIWSLNLRARRDDALSIIDEINSETATWVALNCRLDSILELNPLI